MFVIVVATINKHNDRDTDKAKYRQMQKTIPHLRKNQINSRLWGLPRQTNSLLDLRNFLPPSFQYHNALQETQILSIHKNR